MEEIKVGEYIRIDNDFRKICMGVGKVIKIVQDTIYVQMNNELPISFQNNSITKHSKNIIDLIEVGDYVNGYRVLEKTKIKNNEMQICILKDNNSSNWRTVNNMTLNSIVTKEQFAQMEYRVNE